MPVNIQFRRVWEEVEQDRPHDRTLEYVQRQKSHDDITKALVSAVCGVAITVILALLAFAILVRIVASKTNAEKTSGMAAPSPASQRVVSPPPPQPCITSVSPVTVPPRPVETWTYETTEPIRCDGWRDENTADPAFVQTDGSLPTSTPEHAQPAGSRKPGGTYAYAWPSREGEPTPTYWNPRARTPSRRRSW